MLSKTKCQHKLNAIQCKAVAVMMWFEQIWKKKKENNAYIPKLPAAGENMLGSMVGREKGSKTNVIMKKHEISTRQT